MSRNGTASERAGRLEALRILREYRRLVLLGRVRLPLVAARRLVGPDCAFHLYFRHAGGSKPRAAPPRRARRRGSKKRRR